MVLDVLREVLSLGSQGRWWVRRRFLAAAGQVQSFAIRGRSDPPLDMSKQRSERTHLDRYARLAH